MNTYSEEKIYESYSNEVERMQKYIDELLQENKQLKEQLLVTQTNEETFRLEMEDITRALGLAEDTLFDDVKVYARSLKENKQLKGLIDTILNFSFFKEECPLNFGFEDNSKEDKAQNIFYSDEYCENNCNDSYKDCWLKYFKKLQELEQGSDSNE